jgi:hypothetical protein
VVAKIARWASYQSLVADEFPGEPEERLLKVVVGLGRDIVVLEVLLAVEGDGLGLDLALLHVDLVAGKDNGDVLADTDQVTCDGLAKFCTALGSRNRTVPVGDVLVCDTRGDVEHDNTALAVDVVSIAETTELLLTCGVPDVELDLAEVLAVLLVCRIARARIERRRTVVKPRGWTSTPSVAMYFFSNSPVKWRLTKVVCGASGQHWSVSVRCCDEFVVPRQRHRQPQRRGVRKAMLKGAYLSSSAVTNKHELEGGHVAGSVGHGC